MPFTSLILIILFLTSKLIYPPVFSFLFIQILNQREVEDFIFLKELFHILALLKCSLVCLISSYGCLSEMLLACLLCEAILDFLQTVLRCSLCIPTIFFV